MALSFTLSAPSFAQDAGEGELDALDEKPAPPPVIVEPAGAVELRDAIRRIASRPTDSYALTDAGYASLKLGDADAAYNFFTRASNLQPADPRIKAGLASALVRRENPFEALKLFDEAARLGGNERSFAMDRGIAYDLLGNFERAQRDYQSARAYGSNDELVRRQAVSLSLLGKSADADAMLYPLLQRDDAEAWRARAFILASRGEAKEAEKIALSFLSEPEARRLEYYFRQMQRLTPAQQAAALHFGNFPTGSNIGQDSEQVKIAAVASGVKPRPAAGDGRLIPSGEPLGAKTAKTREAKKPRDTKPSKKDIRLAKRDNPAPVTTATAQAAIDRAAAAAPRPIQVTKLPPPETARPLVRIVLPSAKPPPLPASLPAPLPVPSSVPASVKVASLPPTLPQSTQLPSTSLPPKQLPSTQIPATQALPAPVTMQPKPSPVLVESKPIPVSVIRPVDLPPSNQPSISDTLPEKPMAEKPIMVAELPPVGPSVTPNLPAMSPASPIIAKSDIPASNSLPPKIETAIPKSDPAPILPAPILPSFEPKPEAVAIKTEAVALPKPAPLPTEIAPVVTPVAVAQPIIVPPTPVITPASQPVSSQPMVTVPDAQPSSGPGFTVLEPQVPAKIVDVAPPRIAPDPPKPDQSAPQGPTMDGTPVVASPSLPAAQIAVEGPKPDVPVEAPKGDTPKVDALASPEPATPTPVSEKPAESGSFDLGSVVGSIAIPETEQVQDVTPVDLKKIKPIAAKTEDKAKADAAKPAKAAASPARIWVQIATGADANALSYDYRRWVKKFPGLFATVSGHSAAWNKSRRLLVGPFADLKAAKRWDGEFRKIGGNGFVWQSENGTAVEALKAK